MSWHDLRQSSNIPYTLKCEIIIKRAITKKPKKPKHLKVHERLIRTLATTKFLK